MRTVRELMEAARLKKAQDAQLHSASFSFCVGVFPTFEVTREEFTELAKTVDFSNPAYWRGYLLVVK